MKNNIQDEYIVIYPRQVKLQLKCNFYCFEWYCRDKAMPCIYNTIQLRCVFY